LPIFEMRPSLGLPPEEFCLGVSPRKAANSRGPAKLDGIVKLSERRAEEGGFSERWDQAVAPVLEISRQAAKARSREVRRKSAGADSG
jgi:hypothetical protein